MKKLFLISLLFVVLGITASAQKQSYPFANDTVQADTSTYAGNRAVEKYSTTVVTFTFVKVDVADSLSVAKIQGSNNNVNFYDLADASANLAATSTDGVSRLYVTNPLDLYYRGFLACASGDTVAVTNAILIVKED